jgi:hypothetical protein
VRSFAKPNRPACHCVFATSPARPLSSIHAATTQALREYPSAQQT